jgi:hypothetical protein
MQYNRDWANARVEEGIEFQSIQTLLEDLQESGLFASLEVVGYELRIWVGDSFVTRPTLKEVATYLRDLNAGLIAEHGEMGGM